MVHRCRTGRLREETPGWFARFVAAALVLAAPSARGAEPGVPEAGARFVGDRRDGKTDAALAFLTGDKCRKKPRPFLRGANALWGLLRE